MRSPCDSSLYAKLLGLLPTTYQHYSTGLRFEVNRDVNDEWAAVVEGNANSGRGEEERLRGHFNTESHGNLSPAFSIWTFNRPRGILCMEIHHQSRC